MFSDGQITFGIIFFIVFSILVAFTYKKDAKLHSKYYKGSYRVLIAFISFIGLIALIKFAFM
jgi:cbb3-type cytochrome oxidase subunit 3